MDVLHQAELAMNAQRQQPRSNGEFSTTSNSLSGAHSRLDDAIRSHAQLAQAAEDRVRRQLDRLEEIEQNIEGCREMIRAARAASSTSARSAVPPTTTAAAAPLEPPHLADVPGICNGTLGVRQLPEGGFPRMRPGEGHGRPGMIMVPIANEIITRDNQALSLDDETGTGVPFVDYGQLGFTLMPFSPRDIACILLKEGLIRQWRRNRAMRRRRRERRRGESERLWALRVADARRMVRGMMWEKRALEREVAAVMGEVAVWEIELRA